MKLTTTALVAPSVNGPLEFQDMQLDELRADEALVAIHAVGVCHAELSCLHGRMPVKFPNVFGHEGTP
jgi:Zn-dependent alcohol dehydrogenase